MNDLGLKGKVAIVTGAGGGIGREIALALACEGVKIVANDIGVSLSGEGGSIQPAEETCGLITQKGGEAIPDNHSVTSWSSASKIIENTLDNFKRIDIVINNAGILRKAFNCLPIMVKPGGKLCVDYYWKRFLTMMHAKYFFRPFTKKMSHEKLFNIIKFLLPSLLYISNAFLKIPFIGKPLQRL